MVRRRAARTQLWLDGGRPTWRAVAAASAAALVATLAALVVPATANAADPPTYGGYLIDGTVPDTGGNIVQYGDPYGNADELGPKNGSPQQLAAISSTTPPVLDTTNPNAQTDFRNVWMGSNAASDGVWFYGAWERDSNNGSGFIMFEFDRAKQPAACAYGSKTDAQLIASCNPWANRQAGDFVIAWDQSGNSTTIIKRTFVAAPGGGLQLDAGVTLDSSVVKAAYGSGGFRGELAVNLSKSVFDATPTECKTIANVIPMTVTGNSDTADVKDTVLADTSGSYLSSCGRVVLTKVTQPTTATGSFPVTVARSSGAAVAFDGSLSKSATLTSNGDTRTIPDLKAGTDYTVTENVPSGWEQISLTCDRPGATAGTYAVVAGGTTSCTVTNKKALPALSLDKTSTTTSYSAVGQTIPYSYAVTNTGNVVLTGPVTVDDDRTSVTCPATATLAVDATVTCSATYTVTQADIDSGSVTNTAVAHASYAGAAVDSLPDSVTVNATQTKTLALDKTATPGTYSAVGTVISYQYLVTNTGNTTLAGPVTVADDKVTVTCPAGSLAPGGNVTCTASHVVTQADIDAGSITNTATASAGGVTSPQDQATVTAVQTKLLALDKTASPKTYDAVGQTISYSYAVTNNGNVTLAGPVTVDDDKVTVTCPSGSLAPGATKTCSASHTVTQADLDAGEIVNHATAHAGGTTSNPDTETVKAVQNPALGLEKSASPLSYDAVGQTITYGYTVTNTGNVTLTAPIGVSDDKVAVTCPATASLLPGAHIECSASHTVTQADLDSGTIVNIATAHADFGGDTVSSAPDTATVTAVAKPALGITKTPAPTTYAAVGDQIGYSYVVTNTGNVTLSGPFAVVDDKATATCPDTASLAPAASITCSATYTATQADLDAGSVTNTAYATGGGATSPTVDATVDAVQSPALSIEKTASPTTYSAAKQVVSYSYAVTNTGNVTLSAPFTVTDDKTSNETCPAVPTTLAPGQTITCSSTYAVTQADVNAGSVTNVASAHASFGESTVDSPTDTATVTAVQSTGLSLVKTPTPTTYDAVGQTITYSYVATNTGNVTLSGPFSLTDDKTTGTCAAVGSVDPGGTVSCSATYDVTQADLDAGSVTNLATVSNGTVTSNQASATVLAEQSPALSVTKTPSPTTYSAVGDTVGYTYVVTNSGNVTLSGPFSVVDDKASATCPATATLAPGASITCTATYTASQADLDAGSVTNTAYATGGGATSPTVQATVTAVQAPALGVVKTPTPVTYDAVNDVVSYSYVVTNTGNVTLDGPVTVSDDKTSVTCPSVAVLAPGATVTCSSTYVIGQADLDAGSVTNEATAAATWQESPVVSAKTAATVDALQTPKLGLDKTASPATYDSVGDVITYGYAVTNLGNVTLSGPVTVSDDKTTVTCPAVATLAPDATVTCSASYAITQADLDHGVVTNVASASAVWQEGPVTSEPDSATVSAVQTVTLGLDKSATPTTYAAVGDVIAYLYLVTNTGNVTLSGPVTVADDKVSVTCPSTATLAPGSSVACTASHTITQADLDAGSITNTATAAATFGGDDVVSPPDTATVAATQTPVLSIEKSADPVTYDAPGDVITYSYVVRNAGNVTLSGPVSVNDDKTTVTCPDTASLAPGASVTCTAAYTVTQADVDAGSVTNTARAFAVFGEQPVSSEPDQATVTADQAPVLSLTKTASPNSYQVVGDVITYTYVVKNSGNTTLAGPFTVADDKTSVTCPATASLAPGASLTCTASYRVTQADVDAKQVTNVATATNGTITSPPATVTVLGVAVEPTVITTPSPSPTVLPFVPERPRTLPFTGADLLLLLALGSGLSLIGALLVGAGRRRRTV